MKKIQRRKERYTNSDGKYHDVGDINERPDDTDDGQTTRRNDVDVNQSVLEIVAKE